MGKLNVDDEEVKKIVGISVSEVSGDFSPEWLSCTFMENVIKEINSAISTFNQIKSEANGYTTVNEEISNQPEPEVPSSGGGSGGSSSSLGSESYSSPVSGISSLILKSLPKDSQVTIIEADDGSGWIKIRLADGTEGYIETKLLKVEGDSLVGMLIAPTNVFAVKPEGKLYSTLVSMGLIGQNIPEEGEQI